MAFLQILFHNNYCFYFQNIWIQCRFDGKCLNSNRSLPLLGHSKIFQKTLILAFEANSALSRQIKFFLSFSSLCNTSNIFSWFPPVWLIRKSLFWLEVLKVSLASTSQEMAATTITKSRICGFFLIVEVKYC